MVEFNIKINEEQGTAYIPKEIREALGHLLKARANLKTVIIYPAGTDARDLQRSLETLLLDVKHQVELELEQKQKEPTKHGRS